MTISIPLLYYGESVKEMQPGFHSKNKTGRRIFYYNKILHYSSFMLVTALLNFTPTLQAREITRYSDEKGRNVYINSEDQELTLAVNHGGVERALQVIEGRKRQLPNIDSYIRDMAISQQIDPKLIDAVIEVESGWNPRARSQKGAEGLMQLMPKTAQRFGVRDSFDPRENIAGGVKYLHYLTERFDRNLSFALAAYNAGEEIVAERGAIPPYKETRDYVQRVQALYKGSRDKHEKFGSTKIQEIARGGAVLYTNLY